MLSAGNYACFDSLDNGTVIDAEDIYRAMIKECKKEAEYNEIIVRKMQKQGG